eukprot:105236-Pyramimonas_sp.AAC.1
MLKCFMWKTVHTNRRGHPVSPGDANKLFGVQGGELRGRPEISSRAPQKWSIRSAPQLSKLAALLSQ